MTGRARKKEEPVLRAPGGVPAQADFDAYLEAVRARHRLPALAAVVLKDGKAARVSAVGVRRHGKPEAVTAGDLFHIGSCGKAMTATLIALLVKDGKLSWGLTLADALPHLRDAMRPGYRGATLADLLRHRAGVPEDSFPGGGGGLRWFADKRSPREQRADYARAALAQEPVGAPGAKFVYSNAGYAVAGHIAERAAGIPFEELMCRRLFAPLGMATAGQGPQHVGAGRDRGAATWPHRLPRSGDPLPVPPGPLTDNPPVLSPAGTVHLTPADWAKFAALHLGTGGTLLSRAELNRLHAPPPGGDYGMGWIVAPRPWAGSAPALSHAGSNTLNFALAWLAPARGFGVLVLTNAMDSEGGDTVPRACDSVVTAVLTGLIGGD